MDSLSYFVSNCLHNNNDNKITHILKSPHPRQSQGTEWTPEASVSKPFEKGCEYQRRLALVPTNGVIFFFAFLFTRLGYGSAVTHSSGMKDQMSRSFLQRLLSFVGLAMSPTLIPGAPPLEHSPFEKGANPTGFKLRMLTGKHPQSPGPSEMWNLTS